MPAYLLGILFVLFLHIYYLKTRYPARFPPHPALSIPILGDLWLFMSSNFEKSQLNLRRKYGDIFGFLFGSQRVVVLCNYDLIMEAGKKIEMCGRMVPPQRARAKGCDEPWNLYRMPGVTLSQGQVWQEQRRFFLQVLRDIGRKQSDEGPLLDGIKELCAQISSSNGQPLDLGLKLHLLLIKAVWPLCTGKNMSQNQEEELVHLLHGMNKYFADRSNLFSRFLALQPIRSALLLQFQSLDDGEGPVRDIHTFLEASVRETLATQRDESDKCLIDIYMDKIQMEEELRKELSFVGTLGQANLHNFMYDMVMNGSITTSMTLKCAFMFMIQYPEVQEKVQEELDNVIGKGIQPSFADMKQTPYTQAVLMEVQRLGIVLDQGLSHKTTDGCYLSTGHYIPKDTMVFMWLGEVMRDPMHFDNPDTFDPNRFLDDVGLFTPDPRVVNFGVGKRRCPGESMAQMKLYLVFTGILSKFKLVSPKDNDHLKNGVDDNQGAPIGLSSFQIRFMPR